MGITLSQNSIYIHATHFTKTKGILDFYKSRKKYVLMLFTAKTTHFRQLSKDKVEKLCPRMETDFWVQSLTLPL